MSINRKDPPEEVINSLMEASPDQVADIMSRHIHNMNAALAVLGLPLMLTTSMLLSRVLDDLLKSMDEGVPIDENNYLEVKASALKLCENLLDSRISKYTKAEEN